MTYASLLVAVEEGIESDARLELGCDLAVTFNALLIGLSASAPQPPLFDPMVGGAMTGELLSLYRDMAETDVKKAEARFREVTGARGVEAEWRGQPGFPSDLATRTARAADLVIVGSRGERIPYHAPDPADVLMGSGRPVLMVPPAPARSPVGWPAVIAWNDSREARRAIAAALPLLGKAERVLLLSLCAEDENEEADDVAADVIRYLGRHEIRADSVIMPRDSRSTGQAILDFAHERKAGLIVAGGYGHARLRQWALGGVTRTLLAESDLCLLLAH